MTQLFIDDIKALSLNTVQQIQQAYQQQQQTLKYKVEQLSNQILKLNLQIEQQSTTINQQNQQIQKLTATNIGLQTSLQEKVEKAIYLQGKDKIMQEQSKDLQSKFNELDILFKQEKEKRKEDSKKIRNLQEQLSLKKMQAEQLKKIANWQSYSSISSVSKKDLVNKTYTLDLSDYFKGYPEETNKVLCSLQGESPASKQEQGDMCCMLIGRDNLSVQKFEKVNRSFLKRKIKEEEKRFRYIIISKGEAKDKMI